jgi:ubiquinone/menaquinone biosynthesis C-methylase UbiE
MEPIKERIEHYWSHRAEAWRELRLKEFEDDKHERWLAELRKYLPQDRPLRILDLGTGTGFFSLILAAEGHSLTGIDLTPEMIEAAKAKKMPGVELIVGDCENLPFPDGSFDAVICCQSFHHYPNVQDFFNSLYRVLRPGGRLILRDMTEKQRRPDGSSTISSCRW